jgi:competence protein ComEC
VRLVVCCVGFILGDACALGEGIGARGGVVVALASVVALLARRWQGGALLAGFAAGALLGAAALAPPPMDPGLASALDGDAAVALEAEVVRGPEETTSGARLLVSLRRLSGRPARGTLGLGVARGWPDFGPGEIIACEARLRALRGSRNPGLPDPMLALRAAGLDALAVVSGPEAIRRLAEPFGVGPRRAAFLARRALRAAVNRVGGEPGALLATTVLGARRGVSADIEEGFRAAGATHVLSVSGLHLAAVAGCFFVVVRWLAARVPGLPLWIDPRAVAAVAGVPAIGFFTLLTGEAIATERSALMLSIGMAGFVVGRRASSGPAIAATALVLLAARPLELLDVSLQLSLASVAGLAFGARVLGRRPARGRSRLARIGHWFGRFGAATAAATASTAPLVAHWFGEVAPLSALGNLALVPLVELVVVPVGLAGATLGALTPALGRPVLWLAGRAAGVALAIAAAFRAHAPLWLCRAPNLFETAALTLAGGLALSALGARGRARRLRTTAALAAAGLAAGSLFARDFVRRHDRDLVVTFLDVGQGDAAVVEAPGGAVMIVDGGGTRDGSYDPGARVVEPFLRARGIGRVDLVALSHPHPDHLGGLFRVLERFDVGTFWSSGDDGRNPEYRRLLAVAARRGATLGLVGPRALGAADLRPLGPFVSAAGGERVGAPEGLGVNDASLVLRVAYGGQAVLFPGDLEADGEGELAGRRDVGDPVGADLLKVPHHGSRTSSSTELLDAVRPRVGVISLGWRNQFHFPAPEVLARYAARGVTVLRTDRDGAITVRLAPDRGLSFACERGCPPPQLSPAPRR